MGLGKLFTRGRRGDDVENRYAGSTFMTIIDGVEVGNPLQAYRGAMSIPGAWRSSLLIADILASVPWNAHRQWGDESIELLDPVPPLLQQPAPPEPRVSTFTSWGLDLVWHGNAIGVVAERNSDGYPTALLPVPADQVGVRRVNGSDYSPLPYGSIEYNIGGHRFDQHDVVHIKGPCQPGAVRGFGVLEAHLSDSTNTLGLAKELTRQASTISRNGVPTGKLKVSNPDATEDELKAVKARWLQAQRDRTVAVLNATTDFEPLAWNPDELQLVEARKFTLHEIALVFGLPLSFLGADQASRTYSNIEQEAINLIKFTMRGHIARFEQTLSQAFPRGTFVKANLDSILRADTLTRYQAHNIGLSGGFLTANEVREMENRPPLTAEQRAEIAARQVTGSNNTETQEGT